MCNHKVSTVVDPRFQIRHEIGDLFITNMYTSHRKIVYNHVSDVDIVSNLQNTQLYKHLKYYFNTSLIVHPTSTRISAALRNRITL